MGYPNGYDKLMRDSTANRPFAYPSMCSSNRYTLHLSSWSHFWAYFISRSTGFHSSTASAPKIVSYAASYFVCSYKCVPEFNIDHISDCFPDFTHTYV